MSAEESVCGLLKKSGSVLRHLLPRRSGSLISKRLSDQLGVGIFFKRTIRRAEAIKKYQPQTAGPARHFVCGSGAELRVPS